MGMPVPGYVSSSNASSLIAKGSVTGGSSCPDFSRRIALDASPSQIGIWPSTFATTVTRAPARIRSIDRCVSAKPIRQRFCGQRSTRAQTTLTEKSMRSA